MEEIVLNLDVVVVLIEEIRDSEMFLKEFFWDVFDVTRDVEVECILFCFKLNLYEFLNFLFDCERKVIFCLFCKIFLFVYFDKCKYADVKAAFDALG